MASRHRVQESGLTGANLTIAAISAAVVFAAVVSAAVVYFIGSTVSYAGQAPEPAPPAQHISQEGTIVAVSADSVTARGADGWDRTYIVNADTAAITGTGSQVGSAGSTFAINDTFAVNDEVSIVGVLRDGTSIATAVADRSVSSLNGPPMDYALP